MKKIFCVTCHKLTYPLRLTVEYLSSFKENTVLIHVDDKFDMEPFNFLRSENVLFITDRVNVKWGGYSQIESTIKLLTKSLSFDFKYLFFISGDDLPCKSNQEINDFINSIEFKNMVHFQDERNSYVDPEQRVKYNYPLFFFNKRKNILDKVKSKVFKFFGFLFINKSYKESLLKGMVFYKGTSWFSLNNMTVRLLLNFLNENEWYFDIYKKSLCGDEVFFHTALKYLKVNDFYHNPNEMNDALRYIDWKSGPEYPKILNSGDLFSIKETSCLFARKFTDESASDIIKCFILDSPSALLNK